MTGRYRCGHKSERSEGKGRQLGRAGRNRDGEEGLEGVEGERVGICVGKTNSLPNLENHLHVSFPFHREMGAAGMGP